MGRNIGVARSTLTKRAAMQGCIHFPTLLFNLFSKIFHHLSPTGCAPLESAGLKSLSALKTKKAGRVRPALKLYCQSLVRQFQRDTLLKIVRSLDVCATPLGAHLHDHRSDRGRHRFDAHIDGVLIHVALDGANLV